LAGGDLDRRGGDGSPAMSGLGRLVLGSVVLVWLWAPDTLSARPFVSIRFGGGGAQQDIDGDGGRYPVRSCADASGRAVRALWRARRSGSGVRRCAVAPGRVALRWAGSPASRVDDVRMGACSGPRPVRDDPLRIGSTLRAHGCRLATSLRRARGRWGMPTVGRSRRRRSRALWPTRRAGQWSRPATSACRTLGSI
jgi:hypothetical protein